MHNEPPQIIFYLCKGKRLGMNHIEWSFIPLESGNPPEAEEGYTYLLGREEIKYQGAHWCKTFYVGNLPVTSSEGYGEK